MKLLNIWQNFDKIIFSHKVIYSMFLLKITLFENVREDFRDASQIRLIPEEDDTQLNFLFT